MRQNSAKKLFFSVLFFLLIFLCCLPAVSRAVQSGSLPEVTDTFVVSADTTVAKLGKMLNISKPLKLTVYKADGSIRPSGPLATGDRAVIQNPSGDVIGCILITVEGQSSPSSAASSAVSSEVSSEVSSAPASESSEPEAPSSQPESSETTSSAPQPEIQQEFVLENSIPVSSAVQLLSGIASRVTVIAPDGSARKDGLICTGDQLVLQDENGNVFRTINVTVLGDLTRCGRPTESACSILYDYLIGNTSLPADLSAAANVNRDQRIDTADLLRLKQKILENSSSGE
ncbi:MAG: hypothetical protein ACFWUD_04880 [Thermocaproicibacter melissae]|jgi:hypothetical protein